MNAKLLIELAETKACLAAAQAARYQEWKAAITRAEIAERELAACRRARILLHLEVAYLHAEATGDFAQARIAYAAYLEAGQDKPE